MSGRRARHIKDRSTTVYIEQGDDTYVHRIDNYTARIKDRKLYIYKENLCVGYGDHILYTVHM
jgi:hypothetical protein